MSSFNPRSAVVLIVLLASILGSSVFLWEAFRVARMPSGEAQLEYRFGSAAMVDKGGWAYSNPTVYAVSSVSYGLLILALGGLVIVALRGAGEVPLTVLAALLVTACLVTRAARDYPWGRSTAGTQMSTSSGREEAILPEGETCGDFEALLWEDEARHVRGRFVTGEDQEALSGAEVRLRRRGSPTRLASAETSSEGEFGFEGVSPGSYQLELCAPGFAGVVIALEVRSDAEKAELLIETTPAQ